VEVVDDIPRPDSCKNKVVHSDLAIAELRRRVQRIEILAPDPE
jgi:hypothetical protein